MKTVYFDFETGGLEPHHPSIQLAAIVVDDETGQEIASFERKIQFDESSCDPKSLSINGYKPEVWSEAISPVAVAIAFTEFVNPHRCIEAISRHGKPFSVAKMAGYNALTFDWPRLKALYGSQFCPCSFHVRDVMQRAMWWFDEHGQRPENLKLVNVCSYFGLEHVQAHEALADVRMTAALAKRMKEAGR